jgi:hypothetical protein
MLPTDLRAEPSSPAVIWAPFVNFALNIACPDFVIVPDGINNCPVEASSI